jgi:hypothetical protein
MNARLYRGPGGGGQWGAAQHLPTTTGAGAGAGVWSPQPLPVHASLLGAVTTITCAQMMCEKVVSTLAHWLGFISN